MSCQIQAKVVAHSVGEDAPPLPTFQVRYPRIIHAELMTHRVFSRNARSSRAVPVARLIEEVMTDPFIPRYWGANQKGMQAGAEHRASVTLPYLHQEDSLAHGIELPSRWDEVTDYYPNGSLYVQRESVQPETAWLQARDFAVAAAQGFEKAGYHKQIVNRLLETFMHIDVLITATEWSNFFALRDDDMAEPHIRDLARAMKDALAASTPVLLGPGDWHLPYVSADDGFAIFEFLQANPDWGQDGDVYTKTQQVARAVSVTRCARISYTPFHGESGDIASEVDRHDKLIAARPMHASPLEHQASPDLMFKGKWLCPERHHNLRGWKQYRAMIPGENS